MNRWVKFNRSVAEAKAIEQARRKSRQHCVLPVMCSCPNGYEQTNVDYYQVTAVKGKNVDLRKIDKQVSYAGVNHGACVPLPDSFISDQVFTKSFSSIHRSHVLCNQIEQL